MARNRKRAKERQRRTRQPVASARAEHDDQIDPIRHATPDVEIAEAQMALGRPELADSDASDDVQPAVADDLENPEDGPELSEEEFEAEEDIADAAVGDFEIETDYDEVGPADAGGGRGGRIRGPGEGEGEGEGGGDGASAPVPAQHARSGNKLINFLQGSWRELQRVQWPDRRQVVQATGVVIGFVIVAGVYLGVADTVASHLMNWVLK